jgi:hypothetical protein
MPLKDEVSCPCFTTPNPRRVRGTAEGGYWLRTCLPVLHIRMKQLVSHRTDVNEIWYLSIFGNSVEDIRVSRQSDNNDAYFTCRPIYICDHISLNSTYTEICLKQNLYRKSAHTRLCSLILYENRAIYNMWKKMVQRHRSEMKIYYGACALHAG